MLAFFEGRIFSGQECRRSKPFPDVYLEAAHALDADPKACLVVEDSVAGVEAGVSAGATVIGYSPLGFTRAHALALQAAGAVSVIADLAQLTAYA
jgi:beta-phosphoglucomutase-like phosphatase (HAD superfamily)